MSGFLTSSGKLIRFHFHLLPSSEFFSFRWLLLFLLLHRESKKNAKEIKKSNKLFKMLFGIYTHINRIETYGPFLDPDDEPSRTLGDDPSGSRADPVGLRIWLGRTRKLKPQAPSLLSSTRGGHTGLEIKCSFLTAYWKVFFSRPQVTVAFRSVRLVWGAFFFSIFNVKFMPEHASSSPVWQSR